MSIDESKTKSNEELDSDDESMATEMSSDEEMEAESDEEESDVESVDEVKPTEDVGLKNLLEDQQTSREDNCDNANAVLDSVAAIAQSIQPKGNTLTSTDVVTPIPFLLKHTLREYQHIGLDWLVTMHDRQLNGILADEMGLGKTIQTIALLAHLACVRQNWGPHLIIVPSSVMLNWEMEFKKWCPGFKILTYYGSQKERKQKRIGWTKPNAFHVCITSYKLVIQDHQSFRRKKWKYLILDEAQNIKNFKSQRWQLLLNFVTEQRLLLTGTPLQNNMMELWSLMHFLMPSFFESHRTFEELFSKPMTGMVEGNVEYNENIIMKLHKVLRPFLLRRLKCEVEKQMPKKYEHVVMCRLSKRQRFLYDDFMSRTKTKETLASGNMLSVINVLMQLRKVCNHPNLFEVRPTVSPFRMEQIDLKVPSMLTNIFQYDPLRDIDLVAMNFVLLHFETCLTGFVAHRMKMLATPKKLIEEIDSSPELPPAIPKGKCKMFIRVKPEVNRQLMKWKEIPNTRVSVGTSPVIQRDGTRVEKSNNNQVVPMDVDSDKPVSTPIQIPSTSGLRQQKPTHQLIQSAAGQLYLVNNKQSILTKSGQMVIVNPQPASNVTQPFATACIDAVRNATQAAAIAQPDEKDKEPSEFLLEDVEESKRNYRLHLLQLLHKSNLKKLMANPLYGEDCIQNLSIIFKKASEIEKLSFNARSSVICNNLRFREDWSLSKAIKSIDDRAEELKEIFEKFVLFVPAVTSELPSMSVTHMHPSLKNEEVVRQQIIQQELAPKATLLHPIASAMTTQVSLPFLAKIIMRSKSVL
jgi:E1A-binding protein p400